MNIPHQQIINSFVDKYGLSRGEVIAELERTFSSMLSRWHSKNVVVIYTGEELAAVGYHESETGPVQAPIDISSLRGWNTIRKILEKNLGTVACLKEVREYKQKEGNLIWGEIVSRRAECLIVELQVEFGLILFGTCPLRLLGKHERHQLQPGDRRAFHLRRVESIIVGDTPRTKLTVDRVSKTLVEELLTEELSPAKSIKINCRKRYVGKKSFVESTAFIPKKIILRTAEELGENIQVKVVKDQKISLSHA